MNDPRFIPAVSEQRPGSKIDPGGRESARVAPGSNKMDHEKEQENVAAQAFARVRQPGRSDPGE
jgi:hypothetical protein